LPLAKRMSSTKTNDCNRECCAYRTMPYGSASAGTASFGAAM
jgi:hypothetical protein